MCCYVGDKNNINKILKHSKSVCKIGLINYNNNYGLYLWLTVESNFGTCTTENCKSPLTLFNKLELETIFLPLELLTLPK